MTEIRCKKCNRLLMKVSGGEARGEGDDRNEYPLFKKVEIKCNKCGYINDTDI